MLGIFLVDGWQTGMGDLVIRVWGCPRGGCRSHITCPAWGAGQRGRAASMSIQEGSKEGYSHQGARACKGLPWPWTFLLPAQNGGLGGWPHHPHGPGNSLNTPSAGSVE